MAEIEEDAQVEEDGQAERADGGGEEPEHERVVLDVALVLPQIAQGKVHKIAFVVNHGLDFKESEKTRSEKLLVKIIIFAHLGKSMMSEMMTMPTM